MAISYNTRANCSHIFRATNGGTVFSANLATTGNFDYFLDNAKVNDAIYFGSSSTYTAVSDIDLNVGTPIAGTGIEIVWEYLASATTNWRPIHSLVDETEGFTKTGVGRVQFPAQPNMQYPTAGIGGVSNKVFVRARINALTSITEGGANTTDRVKAGNGALYIGNDYTDANPCTFQELVDWVNANRPDLDASKVGSLVRINNISSLVTATNSPLRSTNEVVFYGCGAFNPASLDANGLWFGTKVGDDGYKDSSILNMCCKSPSSKVSGTASNSTRVYGGQVNKFNNSIDGVDCTPSGPLGMPYGEWIGVRQDDSGYFVDGKDMNKCIVDGNLIIASTIRNFPRNLQIANPTASIFTSYGRSQEIKEMTYSMPTTGILRQGSNYGNNEEIKMIDCTPVLPKQTDPVKVFYRTLGSRVDIANFFKYNASSDTFTDYTTEAKDTNADDVPLDGEVGDIFYISPATATNQGSSIAFDFEITNQENDYEYKLEYWGTDVWKELPFNPQFDSTENFTKSGRVYCATDGNSGTKPITATSVNGVSGAWYRFTIIKKGTATPTFSRVRYLAQNGVMPNGITEQYSYDMTVLENNDKVSGASVRITDLGGEEITLGLTDATGSIPTQILTKKQTVFDAKASNADYNYSDVMKTPHTITIRKYGYEESISSKAVSGKSSDEYKLRTNPYISATAEEASQITDISITDNTILIDEDRTMQEVYDFTQYWATTKLHKDQPYKTTDGATFYSTYDLILDGCELSGNGKINMIVNTVTYLNGATSKVDIVAIDGTHTNITLRNIISGSRVSITDHDDNLVYNDIVADSTLSLPVIWNSDTDLRIRVAYVDGIEAYEWYETTGTLTASGLALNINQKRNTVYEMGQVDGSLVTEYSVDGSVVKIFVDDPDHRTTAQRIYNWYQYYLFTESGIREQDGTNITATDVTHFKFNNGLQMVNQDTDNPLEILGANITVDGGRATDIFDLSNGASICLNFDRVEGFAYSSGSGLSPEQANKLESIPNNPMLAPSGEILDQKIDEVQRRVIVMTE